MPDCDRAYKSKKIKRIQRRYEKKDYAESVDVILPQSSKTSLFSSLPSGLMLSAYARVGAVLGDKTLLERAVQAADFLQEHLWDPEQQTLLRSCYLGDNMELQQM